MVKNGAVEDYRHDATRKNNPPAGLAAIYEKPKKETKKYAYDPHLDPQLVWAGKAGLKCYEIDPDQTSFEVDVVSLHIHERVSTKAIIDAVKRNGKTVQLKLFEEPELPMDKQIEFYKHEMGWANRLILGDSLLVMNSLLVKEGMAGKVQMIYIDPPYGIKYSSNFQPRIDKRDVKDKDEDLTREPEQIKAYRDTWQLGIHSYLSYLRDRLLLCRELLAETGSIFVQINDENLHLVRCLMDEVFGRENFVAIIPFKKARGFTSKYLPVTCDYLIWYAKNKQMMKYRPLYVEKGPGTDIGGSYQYVMLPDGTLRRLTKEELEEPSKLPPGSRIFELNVLESENPRFPFEFRGKVFNQRWKTNIQGLRRLAEAGRLYIAGKTIRYIRFLDDYPVALLVDNWYDTGAEREKLYAVQTNTKVVERCILMTTDPGDLVFDPTCGSGTTAYCAEKWGRRWITCDTSRVAIAIARQRLMTAVFDYYELADPERGVSGGFIYETVPHITLQSIANNPKIDEIAEKYNPKIQETLNELNKSLGKDMKEWEVPRDCPDNWGDEARILHQKFWQLKRQKQEEIDKAIKENAPQEILYDRPKINKKKVRVCGPFTVEAIPVPAVEDPSLSPIPQFEDEEFIDESATNYIDFMIEQLRQVGYVQFPGNRKMELSNVRAVNIGMIHAEAETEENGTVKRVAISFGPQYGPITVTQVNETIPAARFNNYDILIFAGFAIDPEAQAIIQKAPVPGMTILFANVSPDVMLKDLLKTTKSTPIFTVFGEPDIVIVTKENAKDWQKEYEVPQLKDGEYCVILRGVDVYDPNTGTVEHVSGEDVAAWFLDTDYNGMSFRICQAFFPPADAWKKLKKALKAHIDPEVFDRMRGVVSLPFKPGEHGKIAVKVIDFRGNEVIKIVKLGDSGDR